MVDDFPDAKSFESLESLEKSTFHYLPGQHQFLRRITSCERRPEIVHIVGTKNDTCLVTKTSTGEHTRAYGVAVLDEKAGWGRQI